MPTCFRNCKEVLQYLVHFGSILESGIVGIRIIAIILVAIIIIIIIISIIVVLSELVVKEQIFQFLVECPLF